MVVERIKAAGAVVIGKTQVPEFGYSLAHLCGVAPVPASSGKTRRHRLHRGGDRDANRALHLAVMVRMRFCPPHPRLCRTTD